MKRNSLSASQRLGVRVKARRKSLSLTLDQLSDRSGVSRASVSKIERGEMSPTYEVLGKLAIGLDVAITTLAMDSEAGHTEKFKIVRAGNGQLYANPRYDYERLSGSDDHNAMTVYLCDLVVADIGEFPELHAHDTNNFIYVLAGTVGAYFEGRDSFTLEVGDSLTFDGRTKHALIDAGKSKEQTKILWMSLPN